LLRALALREESLGTSHPDVAQTLSHLAHFYQQQGQNEQAHSCTQRALAIREQTLGNEHPESVTTREALFKWYDAPYSP
jgi:hypothetical protein